VLFTAFEPSGDEHAAAVVRELAERHSGVRIYAWGGPKMEAAGATLVERTGDDAVMGMPGIEKIKEHRRINKRITAWLAENPVDLHIPVDSPAANFPICKITRASGCRIVHLVAPQLWAWGRWRVRKLRRMTSMVLCLLPFEESWFRERGVPARYIGHPLFDATRQHTTPGAAQPGSPLPEGDPKIALLPGSRPGEIEKNFPLLVDAFAALRGERPLTSGVVAATTPAVADRCRALAGSVASDLEFVVARTDDALRWADLAIVVSGTVTLQAAKHGTPMVIVYKASPVAYALLGWWLIDTELFTLPNLVAQREVVPELVPHFGDARAIIESAKSILRSPERIAEQKRELALVVERFGSASAAVAAVDEIEKILGIVSADEGEPRA